MSILSWVRGNKSQHASKIERLEREVAAARTQRYNKLMDLDRVGDSELINFARRTLALMDPQQK